VTRARGANKQRTERPLFPRRYHHGGGGPTTTTDQGCPGGRAFFLSVELLLAGVLLTIPWAALD